MRKSKGVLQSELWLYPLVSSDRWAVPRVCTRFSFLPMHKSLKTRLGVKESHSEWLRSRLTLMQAIERCSLIAICIVLTLRGLVLQDICWNGFVGKCLSHWGPVPSPLYLAWQIYQYRAVSSTTLLSCHRPSVCLFDCLHMPTENSQLLHGPTQR